MKKTILIGLMGMAVALQGCAHKAVEKQVDAKVTRESSVASPAALSAEASDIIQESKDLSVEQKSKLLELRNSVRARGAALMDESLKLRSVLIKSVIGPEYNAREVRVLKKKIAKVENKRVELLFDAVEKANKILGRDAAANDRIIRNFAETTATRAK